MQNSHQSSLSPLGNRVTHVASSGIGQNVNLQGASLSREPLNLSVRENLNKSQNVNISNAAASNAYAPQQQMLQSSSRVQKKTSLSFLRKSNITTAGAYQHQNSTP